MKTIEVALDIPFGAPGENTSKESCLFRAFTALVDDGRPIGRINYLFVQGQSGSFNLGALCISSGGLLLFFPGFSLNHIEELHENSEPKGPEAGVHVDHFSLEPGLERWHMTGNRGRIHKHRVLKIDDGLIHWFSVSLATEELLEKTLRNNQLRFPVPANDAERRLSELVSSRDSSEFHHLLFPLNEEGWKGVSHFIHFDFYVDTRSATPLLPFRPFPTLPPLARVCKDPLQSPEVGMHVRSHPVKIPTFPGTIMVCASRHPGRLKYPEVLVHY
jgi:hypothetical protein